MTNDQHDLIELMKETQREARAELAQLFRMPPVARFHALAECENPALSWVLPRAKAITIEELRAEDLSFVAIGRLLGVSAQRVNQLAHPEPTRKGTSWKPKAKKRRRN